MSIANAAQPAYWDTRRDTRCARSGLRRAVAVWFGPLAQRAPSGQIVRVSPEDKPWWRDLRGVPPEGGVSGRLARAAADHPVRFAAVRTVAVVGPAFVLGIWLVGWRTSLAYVLPSVAGRGSARTRMRCGMSSPLLSRVSRS